jgi:hypothetical protein
MDDSLFKRACECQFCQAALRELAAFLPQEDAALDQLLAEVVAVRQEIVFTNLAFAALGAGRPVAARHLVAGAALMPNPGALATLAMHATGDVAQALIEAVYQGKMGWEREATALLLAGSWCRDRSQDKFPQRLIAQARILARQTASEFFVQTQLRALATILNDDGLTSILNANCCPNDPKTTRLILDGLIQTGKSSVFANVPDKPGPTALSGYTVRRAVPRIGRNDPCPCGSGKKYKKCCFAKDQERLMHSSAVPGLTVEELSEQPESYLTLERLQDMRSYELAKLDPAKVAPELRGVLINRLHLFGEHELVLKLFETLGVTKELERHWADALDFTTRAGQKDLVLRLIRLRQNQDFKIEDLDINTRLLLAPNEATTTLNMIEATAQKGLQSDFTLGLVDLAYALMDRSPALGILVTRGLIPITHPLEATTLFDVLLETRDKLNLPPTDPFDEILDQRLYEQSARDEQDSEALNQAHQRLEEKSDEVRQLKAELETLHKELERRAKQPPKKPSPPPPTPLPREPVRAEDHASADLRQRVATLKELLKQRHSERNQLRRDLQKAMQDLESLRQKTAPATPETSAETADQEEDRLLLAAESLGTQPVRLPEFPKKFSETLAALPKPLGRAAITLIGRLAAGDPAAFVGSKRLKMNRDIFRQRVGAAHRLLFRLKPETLEVIALVNRCDLELTIKPLIRN